MTTFEQGPADGQTLWLARAAVFLRVVSKNGQVDALDQPDDEPAADEQISVYMIHGEVGGIHLSSRGKGGRSGFYPIATYRLHPTQPSDAEVRTKGAWQNWCQQNDPRRATA